MADTRSARHLQPARHQPSSTTSRTRVLQGGFSRALVLLNFPVALVAIALTLVAVAALPRSAWLIAGPAIALSALVFGRGRPERPRRPLDQRTSRSRCGAGALADAWRPTSSLVASFAPRLTGDRLEASWRAVVLVLSLPWIAADRRLPSSGGCLPRRGGRTRRATGRAFAAVHLGHHHGGDGALLVRHRAAPVPRSAAAGDAAACGRRATSGSCSPTAR